jgi:DNA-binding CsgD family transcriptional regulator
VSGPLLTANELAVLQRAANGETYAVIARELGYAEKSVSKMALRLARKLGANNITHAVLLGCRAGILNGRPQRHGDHAGYTTHRKRGEEPCDACKAGERAYLVERRRRARQEATDGPRSASEVPDGARDVRGALRPPQRRSGPRGEAAA